MKPGIVIDAIVWEQIVSVSAFKRDLWTNDQICLEFESADGGTTELNEDMSGWNELLSTLPSLLL